MKLLSFASEEDDTYQNIWLPQPNVMYHPELCCVVLCVLFWHVTNGRNHLSTRTACHSLPHCTGSWSLCSSTSSCPGPRCLSVNVTRDSAKSQCELIYMSRCDPVWNGETLVSPLNTHQTCNLRVVTTYSILIGSVWKAVITEAHCCHTRKNAGLNITL